MMQQPPVPSQVVPPQPSDQNSQYQQQPQWMTYQQTQQQQTPVPPPAGWTPQPVPPPTQQTQPYGVGPDIPSDGIRSLWIGDLQQWMDENYLISIFGHTGEVYKSFCNSIVYTHKLYTYLYELIFSH